MATVLDDPAVVQCDCGVEMELVHAGTGRSFPLVGRSVAVRLFRCPRCGDTRRYDRRDGDWARVR